jgi:two-component system response regulator NreC
MQTITAMEKRPIKIFLVDDQSMLRAAFRSLLSRDPRFEVVGDSGDARSAIEMVRELRPDVVLLDISMPGLSGLDALGPMREAHPRVHILMLTHHEGDSFVDQALRGGADGYLSKDSDPAELMLALESVNAGKAYLSPKVSAGLLAMVRGELTNVPGRANRLATLTAREREVFQLLALGSSNKEVAKKLEISLGTAKKHRENLQRKLDCHSSAELARLAIREGLVES